jgi:hypothetical protein
MALFDLIHPVEKIPPKVAILVGEAVYNFRASLDYLVGALAVTNGRAAEHRRRTQFPIESTAEGFAARRHSFLEGISDAHISIIRAYQPFAGCQWTARLAELSNLDKHNALVIVAQGIQIEVHESTGAGRHRVSVSPYLRFEQGGDVGDEVRELGDNVENALARFA